MAQAITTTYGVHRYTATCERGRASVPNMTDNSIDDNHRAALRALVEKFRAEDDAKGGPGSCWWSRGEWIGGGIGKGSKTIWVHNHGVAPWEVVRFEDSEVLRMLGTVHGRLNDALGHVDRAALDFDDGCQVAKDAAVLLAAECGKGCQQ